MRRLAPAVPVLLLLAACTGKPDIEATVASPYTGCAGLTAAGPAAAKPLPDVTLPCFTGGQPVHLADLRGPAVVNVWQTQCAPCREELPAFQRLADRRVVKVVGVITRDSRSAAASFGADLGVTFPNVEDRDAAFLARVGSAALPTTVLVDAAGSIKHVYVGTALTDETLGALVRDHLPEVTE